VIVINGVTRLGDFFANWATFGGSLLFFEKMKKPKEMATFWALFVVANLLHFHQNKQFQNMICCRCFKVSKVV
jgi:hypothetical protein